ncbi:MAG: methylated-DNA--[protein]-cysteine S-methyltransferase [Bacteroidetes bacterium]|nr:methylated-DNA--[protein]-cysteine S-methyltransferase [Bacteroidota bacterium]MBS1741370.1 methylated-DNA--[protein]-cysteine S-methyltransferase [Bacteroidota bacterium]MBS1775175.1 methylated-DNA--[protein]-cysteine S-methyltransferase [Bacteroidota bacterium]
MIVAQTFETPLGKMFAAATNEGICMLVFNSLQACSIAQNRFKQEVVWKQHVYFDSLNNQLSAYFSGKKKLFDVPLHLVGSPFQISVWKALQNIPYGKTTSYQAMAMQIKGPNLTRAVARANSQNPLLILIPCHRVIGSDGSMTGYSGGIEMKRALLSLEKRIAGQELQNGLLF